MTEERVRVTVSDHVATVTLTRADKHNALDPAMFDAIIDAAGQVAATPGVRVVVLHGDGPSFCSGVDLAGVLGAEGGAERAADALRGDVPTWFQRSAYDWIALPVPVIAAIHGNCLGAGLQIALAADIRIAAPDARLSVREVKLGLVPDVAITRTLPRLVGIDVAKELLYTGATVDGHEAHRLGLVTHVADDPLARARELAAEIAANSPDAVRAAKRLLDESWTGPAAETLALEAELQLALFETLNDAS